MNGLSGLLGGAMGLNSMFGSQRNQDHARSQQQITRNQAELYKLLSMVSCGQKVVRQVSPWESVRAHDQRMRKLMDEFDAPVSYIERHQAEMELYA